MLVLENEYLRVSIAEKGAEIHSIQDKKADRNALWNGDPAFWGKFSPVLFPIVGALKDDTYYYNGEEYHMSRHGFARDLSFKIVSSSTLEAQFLLTESEETLRHYPFRFNFYINFRLKGNTLQVEYQLENPSDKGMLFSVGGHPAFAVQTGNGLKYSDYFIHFNKDEALTVHKIIDNLISNETYVLPLHEGRLPLQHALFYEDALVMKDLASDCITLANTENTEMLKFRFSGFPYFGIWAAKDTDFVCLEPWCGIADSEKHNQQLADKEGIISLPGGETWSRRWSVEIS